MQETIINNMIEENKRLHSQLLESYENNIKSLRKQNDTFNEIIKLMTDKFNNETGKLKLKILELGKEIIDKDQLISEMTDSLYSEALYYDTLENDKNY
jgi:predicted nuclease with TOPRIM domain